MATEFKSSLQLTTALARVLGHEKDPIVKMELTTGVNDVPVVVITRYLTKEETERLEKLLNADNA